MVDISLKQINKPNHHATFFLQGNQEIKHKNEASSSKILQIQ